MKKLAFLIFACFFFFSAYSQQNLEIGYFLSNTGEPIDNMLALDPVEGEAINITTNSTQEFIKGYYISSRGYKIEGYIKKQSSVVSFEYKGRLDYPAQTKDIDDNIRSFKVGLDSFTLMQNVEAVNSDFPFIKKPQYVLANSVNDSLTIYKYNSDGSKNYFFEYKNRRYRISDSHKVNEKLLIELFGSNNLLAQHIKSNKLNDKSTLQFFDIYDHYNKFLNQDTIYNKNPFIKATKENAEFYGIIENFSDENFTVTYYSIFDHTKILTGSFNSINPLIKHGDLIWYHPNGEVRKTISYNKNDPTQIITYFSNGKAHYLRDLNGGYEYIYNTKGQLIVRKGAPEQYETILDSTRSRTIKRKYSFGKLIESTIENKEGQILYTQRTKRNLRYPKINDDIWENFDSILKYNDVMIEDQVQGTAFVRVLVNEIGKMQEIEILQGIHPTTNKLIIEAFNDTNEKFQIWKPAKDFNGKYVSQEIVIPIHFGIQAESIRNNFFYDPFMFQQMHQMQMNNIPVPQGF
ncbi:MAG: hypothetical protein ABJO02_17035 [Reichenbachiella sp.]|uniref:hypothetical protein n=1 Tax=Reichenbachiella sp. TaxID=2184521 RepID=UPI003298CF84